MTRWGSAADDGHHRRSVAVDLSSVFGAAAAALPRNIRGRRPRQSREPDPVESEIMEDDVPDTTRRHRSAAGPARAAEPGQVARPAGAPPPRRRFGVVKVRDRQHVDLLLLAAATQGPANGYELIDLVRERSDGLFVLSLRIVVHELRRLSNNRLMQVTGNERVRRYSLTPLGERVLATRRREWEAFSHGLNRVLDTADDLDRRHDAGRAGPARAE
jgi:DNA-binding PadR family transcriptional regulator